jgi:hypothetical protein
MKYPPAPLHSDSMRFVAQASRPGSIESRHVHGCTCPSDMDRTFPWNQERVWEWQGRISLDCPAHGRLLERHIEQVNASMQSVTFDANDTSFSSLPPAPSYEAFAPVRETSAWAVDSAQREPRSVERSFAQRLVDALQGLVRGWRGV